MCVMPMHSRPFAQSSDHIVHSMPRRSSIGPSSTTVPIFTKLKHEFGVKAVGIDGVSIRIEFS